ncbi:fused MFS/spermidine synthase [Limnohabitans sp. Rim8]|uniref:fused MFS/spermidine synthase n=1 Tax=Limnohabitans sp. Rim8 TaxID=1100718 RepID=UPI0033062AE6
MLTAESSTPHTTPVPLTAGHAQSGLAMLLMFASGAGGLVWQMVWTAQFGLALGHEIVAVLSVVAAFFGGISAGSFFLAHRLERSLYPGRWYAGLEALIASWALLVALVSPLVLPHLSQWIGAEPSALWHWALAFFIPLLALLPATLAMGATLPAMERLLRREHSQPLGSVYAANTAGAMAGLLLAVFFFVPSLGLLGTSLVFAGVNATCAFLAWQVWGGSLKSDLHLPDAAPHAAPQRAQAFDATTPLATPQTVGLRLFLTGLLGIGYEVLAVRVISQVTENTVYTYAMLLAVFLMGTALGAVLIKRAGVTGDVTAQRIDQALGELIVSIFLGGISLWWADQSYALPLRWWGPSATTAIAGEWLAGMTAMFLPSMAMGALFTLLCRQALQIRMPLGTALGINNLGSALAPVLVGLVLVPFAGARAVLFMLIAGYLALRSVQSWHRPAGWVAAGALLVLAIFAGPLRFVNVPAGGSLLSYREGVMAAVSVVADADGVARLHINNRVQEGSSASGQVETRLAQLPLLLHPSPRTALFLGYGTGYTANAAALDPHIQVKAVELLPEVIEAAGIFALKAGAPASASPVATVAADARRYVQSATDRHDVIVADLFHPARSGAGNLYTVEHFSAVKARLAPGGLFCQWLALHQMDIETLRSIVAAFLKVYPNAVAVLASNSLDTPVLGLIARPDQPGWQIQSVRTRLSDMSPRMTKTLKTAKLDDEFAVLGSIIAGPLALKDFVRDATLNSDDRPVVTHRAPWVSYAPQEAPRDRLTLLMQRLAPHAADGMAPHQGADAARLEAYWAARAKYIAFGMAVRPDRDPRVMLNQLRLPLLDMVSTSPDFRPASEPLLALAEAVRETDPQLSAQVKLALRTALSTPPSPSSASSPLPAIPLVNLK